MHQLSPDIPLRNSVSVWKVTPVGTDPWPVVFIAGSNREWVTVGLLKKSATDASPATRRTRLAGEPRFAPRLSFMLRQRGFFNSPTVPCFPLDAHDLQLHCIQIRRGIRIARYLI
jgi:hypothetical protein